MESGKITKSTKDNRKIFPLRLDPQLRYEARIVAAKQNKTLTELLTDAVRAIVEQDKQQGQPA